MISESIVGQRGARRLFASCMSALRTSSSSGSRREQLGLVAGHASARVALWKLVCIGILSNRFAHLAAQSGSLRPFDDFVQNFQQETIRMSQAGDSSDDDAAFMEQLGLKNNLREGSRIVKTTKSNKDRKAATGGGSFQSMG